MTVIPQVKEFLGYDADNHKARGKVRAVPSPSRPVPVFRLRQIVANATLVDGHTFVVGGETLDEERTKDKIPVLGDLPVAGRLFRNESVRKVRRHLLFFITPRLIDPAGNAIHTDEEIQGVPLRVR